MTATPDPDPAVTPPPAGPHTVHLALTGDLDYDAYGEFLQQARAALEGRSDVTDLRLDCREAGLVDSMGLSALLQIHRSAEENGIRFHLDHIGPALRRLMELTGTYEHLTALQQPGPRPGPHPGSGT
ncbi:STAS domain-containing protein [Streptomyces ficellus]|uniref:STAS domain-containing protein n=1 Tax=Streptomyces ficellus TaxID=1977088 RepID=UPI00142F2188|nr:STAS domain-containing protein [Streptomyces ficellus]